MERRLRRLRTTWAKSVQIRCADHVGAGARYRTPAGGIEPGMVTVLPTVSWRSPPLAVFDAMKPVFEARFGPPSERDLDSNGIGLFDAHCLRFACGLEVALWRFHLGLRLRIIDAEREPSFYEIYSNERDLAHIGFHLGVRPEQMKRWDGVVIPDAARSLMRLDDNGNEYEVARYTNRCEANASCAEYTARGHKQLYWVE